MNAEDLKRIPMPEIYQTDIWYICIAILDTFLNTLPK